jgi:hypothetical protein
MIDDEPLRFLNPLQNCLSDLCRRSFTTKIRRQHRSLAQHAIHGGFNPDRGPAVAQVAEHHRGGADGGDRVGLVLACDVGRGAVYPANERNEQGGCVRSTRGRFG